SGLTAAYYLSLMGHEVTVFERQEKAGGMLRYGIPAYRLPREKLEADVEAICAAGVTIRTSCDITAGNIADLKENFDCVYIASGAQGDKKCGIPDEDAPGVQSAVELLRALGAGERPDFAGKTVAVVGGGNVAMDAARSLVRLGAARVLLVYRRRVADMPANPEEIAGAGEEGVIMMPMLAPVRVEVKNGRAAALVVQPQRSGKIDAAGRPSPVKADAPEVEIACDAVVVAIGQDIQTAWLAPLEVPLKRGAVAADAGGMAAEGVFAGGDCVSGPATAVRAVAAGKTAAANIDAYLGFDHRLAPAAERPEKKAGNLGPHGRVSLVEREADLRKRDFALIERGMSLEEANQESARCLGCDRCGPANIRGGRRSW
ncbi:MAG TPA: FAD-dependent oxidoreductase, partial [Oscillospiraceae bacterium]|nr:FAD-dependent oxidoreductase [Oscillospiraceae bacterium]